MKLLIQHPHYGNEISGVLTYVNILKKELQKKSIKVKVVSTKEPFRRWLSVIYWSDIVHMNSNNTLFALFCKLFRKKIIIKYHYTFFKSTAYKYKPMSFINRIKKEILFSIPKSNYPLKWKLHTFVKLGSLFGRIITAYLSNIHVSCSKYIAKSLSFPWSVYNLYNPIAFPNRQKLKNLKDLKYPFTFVFVGRLDKDKGIDILLKATKMLQNKNKKFNVLIIGCGSEFEELKKLSEELGISKQIKFLGKISNKKAINIVKNSLALIAPSRWNDPAPYVALEAGSVGTLSIVSDKGGLPEVGGPSAFIFKNESYKKLAKYMEYCLDNPQEALKRGIEANKYIKENFSSIKAANQLIRICNKLMAK